MKGYVLILKNRECMPTRDRSVDCVHMQSKRAPWRVGKRCL